MSCELGPNNQSAAAVAAPDLFPTVQKQALHKQAFDFRYYVCKGEAHLKRHQETLKSDPSPGPVSSDEDLKDGWNRDDTDKPYFVAWQEPPEDLVGREPTQSGIHYVKLEQDKAFHNTAGEAVQFCKPHTIRASWQVTDVRRSGLKKGLLPGGPSTSTTTPKSFRYVDHDFITNDATVDIMNHIFSAAYRGEIAIPWPGMKFGLESDEGKALLASPNGIGAFWLFWDRRAKLGGRKLEVTIFSDGDEACFGI
ncbi:MAG: hypothetical protein Q9216_006735 [Gyalolechia sp. 2 TL-2023]